MRQYRVTFMYADIRDDETEQRIMKLVAFLLGTNDESNSDEAQLSVIIAGVNNMHDIVDAGLSLDTIDNVLVENWGAKI